MNTFSITDSRWPGNLVGGLFLLGAIVLILFVWLTSVRPFPDRWLSIAFYYAVALALVGAA